MSGFASGLWTARYYLAGLAAIRFAPALLRGIAMRRGIVR